MVGSRHLQGTIISRVKYLLESGSLKQAPIWYDIVRRFPPPTTSLLSTVAEIETGEVLKVTYHEDEVKRTFYKDFFRAARDPQSLISGVKVAETKTDYFLKSYYQLLDEGHPPEKALQDALTVFKEFLSALQQEKYQAFSSSGYSDNESLAGTDEKSDLEVSDIYEIFSSNATKLR